MKHQSIRSAYLGPALLITAACVTVHAPKGTVALSEIIAQQTEEMRASHVGFVRLYYSEVRAKIDRFMAETWIPAFLAKATQNEEFRAEHELAVESATLDPNSVSFSLPGNLSAEAEAFLDGALTQAIEDARARLGDVLIGFGEAALKEIRIQRATLISPIDEQEKMVLDELRTGYADLQLANAAIKGYLESVVELREESDAIAQKVGLLDVQKKVLSLATEASDAAVRALSTAEGAEAGIAAFLEFMGQGKARIDSVRTGSTPVAPLASPAADTTAAPDSTAVPDSTASSDLPGLWTSIVE